MVGKIFSAIFVTLSVVAIEVFVGLLFGYDANIVYLLFVAVSAVLLVLSVISPKTFSNPNPASPRVFLFSMALALFVIAATIAGVLYAGHAALRTIGIAPLVMLLAGVFVLTAIMVVNLIISGVQRKNFQKMRITEVLKGLMQDRAEIDKFSGSIKKIGKLMVVNYASLVAILAAFVAVMVGAVGMTAHGGFWIAALVLAVPQGFVVFALLPDASKFGVLSPESRLTSTDYPLLHKLITEAAQMVGVRPMFRVYLAYEPNVSIRQTSGGYEILIGKDVLRLLSETELQSVMVHEFAHAAHGDLRLSRRIARMEAIAEHKTLLSLFVGAQMSAVANLAERYRMVCTKNCEEAADRTVKEKGMAQSFIDATAKLTMLEYYNDALVERNIFEVESFGGCFSIQYCMEFLKCYETHGEQWRKMCRIELPARLGTHPACSERMQNLQISDFTIDFYNISDEGMEQAKKAYQLADKLIGYNPNDWDDMRKVNYIKPMQVVEDYQREGAGALKEVVDAFFMLCRYEDCLAVLDKVLEANPNDAYALYKKGVILCGKEELEGVEYLKRAVDASAHYVHAAIERMFNFVARRGMVAKRQSLRDWADAKMDDEYTFAKKMFLQKESGIALSDLPVDVAHKITDILKQEGVLSCRILKDGTGKKTVYHILIEPLMMAWANSYDEMGHRIFNELASFSQMFFIVDVRYEKRLEKKANQLNAPFLFCEPNSRYHGGVKRYSYERRRSRIDFVVKYFAALSLCFALGAFITCWGFVPLRLVALLDSASRFTAQQMGEVIVSLVLFVVGGAILCTGFFLSKIPQKEERKERARFINHQFVRDRLTVPAKHRTLLLGILEQYFMGSGFEKKEIGTESEQVFVGKLGTSNPKIEICFKVLETDDDSFITVESFMIVSTGNTSYETGMQGAGRFLAKRQLKRYNRSVLNVLCAPADMRI